MYNLATKYENILALNTTYTVFNQIHVPYDILKAFPNELDESFGSIRFFVVQLGFDACFSLFLF